MQIPLDTPITRSTTISAFEIARTIDVPDTRTVSAEVAVENVGFVTLPLWEGDAYDEIGDWTQAQAEARCAEVIAERYGNA